MKLQTINSRAECLIHRGSPYTTLTSPDSVYYVSNISYFLANALGIVALKTKKDKRHKKEKNKM